MNNAQKDIGITIMCLYVTLRYCVKRTKPIVKKFYRLVFLQLNPTIDGTRGRAIRLR